MNNTFQGIRQTTPQVEPLEERVDELFRELELAVMWQGPSILLAIYSSTHVHDQVKNALRDKLVNIQQEVHQIQVSCEHSSNIPLYLSEIAASEKTVFFIEGLGMGGGKDGKRAYRALSIGREYFTEHRIRSVFWLTEAEANDLAHYAPDFWAYRHRAIEFIESPAPEQVSRSALEANWQGIGEFAELLDDLDAKIALRDAMLNDLPDGNESIAMRANLLFSLGVLHWRRGDLDKAFHFLQTTLGVATHTNDSWLEAVGLNALALVNNSLGKIDDAVTALKQAAALAPQQAFPWNNLGNLYSQLNRHEEALASLEKAITINPLDAISWNGLGNVYHKLGRGDDAVVAYHKAIACGPNCAFPWIGLGEVFVSLERIEEAITAFQRAIEINETVAQPWISLGKLYDKQGRSVEAVKTYQRAFEIDPKNVLIWLEQGNVYLNAGAYEAAITAYQKAIEQNPKFGQAYCSLAFAYSLRGKFAEAIPLYQKSIELRTSNKDEALAWNRLGHAYEQLNDSENVIIAYQRAIELAPEEAAYKHDLDEIHRAEHRHDPGRSDEECHHHDDATTVDQKDRELVQLEACHGLITAEAAYGGKGLRYAESAHKADNRDNSLDAPNGYESAVLSYQRNAGVALLNPPGSLVDVNVESSYTDAGQASAPGRIDLAVEPDRSFAWVDLGELRYSTGQLSSPVVANTDRTRGTGQGAGDVFPSQAAVLNETQATCQETMHMPAIGMSKKEDAAEPVRENAPTISHENDEAIATYQRVTELNPQNARAWHKLGTFLRTSGRYEEAVVAFNQAVSLDPKQEVFHYHQGLVYAALKRYEDAIRSFLKVVELNPDYNLAHCTLAGYYRRLGQENEALKHIDIASPTMKGETEYNRACFAAICGDADQAISLLKESLEKKQTSQDWVRRDPDFEFIRSDPRFAELVGV
jgi:tetratricopeptide (TPR) repeat protein